MALLRSAAVRPVLSAMFGPSSKVNAMLWQGVMGENSSVETVINTKADRRRKRAICVGMAGCYAARASGAIGKRRVAAKAN